MQYRFYKAGSQIFVGPLVGPTILLHWLRTHLQLLPGLVQLLLILSVPTG
jgi:hypothetical protein